jgi:hypothetical protein
VLRHHPFCRFSRDQKAAERSNNQRSLHFGGVEVDERSAGAVARVVDDNIRRSERRFDVGEEFSDLSLFGGVAGKCLAAGFLRQRPARSSSRLF